MLGKAPESTGTLDGMDLVGYGVRGVAAGADTGASDDDADGAAIGAPRSNGALDGRDLVGYGVKGVADGKEIGAVGLSLEFSEGMGLATGLTNGAAAVGGDDDGAAVSAPVTGSAVETTGLATGAVGNVGDRSVDGNPGAAVVPPASGLETGPAVTATGLATGESFGAAEGVETGAPGEFGSGTVNDFVSPCPN